MPDMKIVSKQSAEDLAKRRAVEALSWAVRRLTANLLRIVAGAGRDEDVFQQVLDCAEKIAACERLNVPSFEISLALHHDELEFMARARPDDRERWANDGTAAKAHALQAILMGSLRMVASEMLGQLTQSRVAESKIRSGIEDWNTVVEARRKAVRAAVTADSASRRRKKAKAKSRKTML